MRVDGQANGVSVRLCFLCDGNSCQGTTFAAVLACVGVLTQLLGSYECACRDRGMLQRNTKTASVEVHLGTHGTPDPSFASVEVRH